MLVVLVSSLIIYQLSIKERLGRVMKFQAFYFISNEMVIFSEVKTYMEKVLRKIEVWMKNHKISKNILKCSSKVLLNPGVSEYK